MTFTYNPGTNMQEHITTLTTALADTGSIDHETRGQLVELVNNIATKLGEPYTYGLPGSDPNVEQLPNGSLRITLIAPIKSGTEMIEQLRMRAPTLGDNRQIKTAVDSEQLSELTQGLIEKVKLLCVADSTERKLTPSQIDMLSEEDGRTIAGAISFLAGRFRRTGKTYKSS